MKKIYDNANAQRLYCRRQLQDRRSCIKQFKRSHFSIHIREEYSTPRKAMSSIIFALNPILPSPLKMQKPIDFRQATAGEKFQTTWCHPIAEDPSIWQFDDIYVSSHKERPF